MLATVVLIVYVALMLDIALSPTSQGESDNASGVGVVLRNPRSVLQLNGHTIASARSCAG